MALYWKPSSVIKEELGIDSGGSAHAFFTHTCRIYMDQFVPYSGLKKSGDHLRENVTEEIDRIIYNVPYASYQYHGERYDDTHKVVNYTTPGTGPYWDKLMLTARRSELLKDVADYVKTHGGK